LAALDTPFLTRVDHCFVESNDAEQLFGFCKDKLQLPEVWPFARYGAFASGGLSLGNVVLEFVTFQAASGAAPGTAFRGIAFEPMADADAAVLELNRRHIPHGEPEPYKFKQDGRERVGWVTIGLTDMLPANAYIFICDYKDRERIVAGQVAAGQELNRRDGGPSGIDSLKEIVVAVTSVEEAAQKWERLLQASASGVDPLFALGSGPQIRLVRAESEGIQSVLLRVKSKARAERFLVENQMAGGSDSQHLWIAPSAVGGLRIALVEE